MKSKFTIEEEVQKTMNALDNLSRVEGNPYLFTRVKAQLEREQKNSFQVNRLAPQILSWSFVLLLLAINIFTIRENFSSENVSDTLVEAISTEYGLEASSADYLNQN